MTFLKKNSLYIAWLLSLLGVIVSLYYSEVRHIEPCHLCWLQRIALYPLVIILGIASYRNFYGISFYLLPQIIFGLIAALYQVAIQEIPGFNPIDICGAGPNCTTKHFIGSGPLTLPMLSAVGFIAVLLLLSASLSLAKKGEY